MWLLITLPNGFQITAPPRWPPFWFHSGEPVRGDSLRWVQLAAAAAAEA